MTTLTIFNDVKRIVRRSRLETEGVTSIFGDVILDLTQASLEPGEHELRLVSVFGDIKLRIPEHIGLDLRASTIFSDVEIETLSSGEEEQPGGSWTSENFERAAVRISISVQGMFGDIKVVRLPVAQAQTTPLIGDSVGALQPQLGSYEGETSRLRSSDERDG